MTPPEGSSLSLRARQKGRRTPEFAIILSEHIKFVPLGVQILFYRRLEHTLIGYIIITIIVAEQGG